MRLVTLLAATASTTTEIASLTVPTRAAPRARAARRRCLWVGVRGLEPWLLRLLCWASGRCSDTAGGLRFDNERLFLLWRIGLTGPPQRHRCRGTIKTGQGVCRTIFSATLPMRRWAIPPRPCVESTIKSGSISCATARIFSYASP